MIQGSDRVNCGCALPSLRIGGIFKGCAGTTRGQTSSLGEKNLSVFVAKNFSYSDN